MWNLVVNSSYDSTLALALVRHVGNILIYVKLYISVSTHEEVWISIMFSLFHPIYIGRNWSSWIVGVVITAVPLLPLHFYNIYNRQWVVSFSASHRKRRRNCTVTDCWYTFIHSGRLSIKPITLKAFAAISVATPPETWAPIQKPNCWIVNLTICSLSSLSESPKTPYLIVHTIDGRSWYHP